MMLETGKRRGKPAQGKWTILIERRMALDLSQTDLAAHFGVVQEVVSAWETLRRPPEWRYLAKLAEFLGISVTDLASNIAENFLIENTANSGI